MELLPVCQIDKSLDYYIFYNNSNATFSFNLSLFFMPASARNQYQGFPSQVM